VVFFVISNKLILTPSADLSVGEALVANYFIARVLAIGVGLSFSSGRAVGAIVPVLFS
jgi:hypothetical protein